MKFKDILKDLPGEFIYIMESEIEESYKDVYDYLTNIFENNNYINGEDAKGKQLSFFIQKIYELAFYSGFKFAVDPDDLYPQTLNKVYDAGIIESNSDK